MEVRRAVDRPSWLIRLVLGAGLAKDESGARRSLAIVLGVLLLAIFVLWVFGTPAGGAPEQLPAIPSGV